MLQLRAELEKIQNESRAFQDALREERRQKLDIQAAATSVQRELEGSISSLKEKSFGLTAELQNAKQHILQLKPEVESALSLVARKEAELQQLFRQKQIEIDDIKRQHEDSVQRRRVELEALKEEGLKREKLCTEQLAKSQEDLHMRDRQLESLKQERSDLQRKAAEMELSSFKQYTELQLKRSEDLQKFEALREQDKKVHDEVVGLRASESAAQRELSLVRQHLTEVSFSPH
jgi:hypothetical protein